MINVKYLIFWSFKGLVISKYYFNKIIIDNWKIKKKFQEIKIKVLQRKGIGILNKQTTLISNR